MKYAIINNNEKTEPRKNLKGLCPNCGAELIAKCGERRINHWAHKGIRNCDPWWENETEWHRTWKNNFPNEWQEVVLKDEITSERHIADLRTNTDLIIEFQHSAIKPEERIARESFYKNMVWIVDGTRLKFDYTRFLKGLSDFRRSEHPNVFYFDASGESFPSMWLKSSVPVIFDFKGHALIDDPKDPRNYLYCLQPNINSKYAFLAIVPHSGFIEAALKGVWENLMHNFFVRLNKYQQLQQAYATRMLNAQRPLKYRSRRF